MESVTYLSEIDMIIRLGLGFLGGGLIGLERSSRRQVAGLRTHILIATGATLLMLLSIYLPQEFASPLRGGDPGRIAAQVVSGIGFLGAGAIIRLGNNIRGLTTAASLWFVAALGLAIGGGMFLVAGAALVLGLFALRVLAIFERRLFPSGRIKTMVISYKINNPNTREALALMKEAGMEIQSMDINQGSKDRGTRLRLLVQMANQSDIASIARSIKSLDNVGKVEIKERY
ncbi:MAG: MgtC/SapB family protein [Treponema sp.]|nr:MgtC/SapB family protein [Treponema sp.]